ncbi:MAG: type II secretion system protein [Alphaproteobacteria bacterium]
MASSATSNRKGGGGFTLIELLVVLAILAGLLYLVVPRLSARGGAIALHAAAADLAAELRLVRSAAIATDDAKILIVDPKHNRFAAEGDVPFHFVPRDVRMTVLTAESELLPDGTPSIRFFPDGSSTGGGVELAGWNATVVVAVDWLTGQVSLHDKRP